MDWEVLASLPKATVRRRGRFIVTDLLADHRVISTSQINGGQTDGLRHLVNHQCCEGKDHNDRFHVIVAKGEDFYHETVCAEIELPPGRTAMMATAANMNYAACAARSDADVEVLAVVTAGVETNAVCAGDPASSRELSEGVVSVPVGTINTILLSNMPLSPGALARTVITMAEAKSAALQRLAVPSCYSSDLATGTGTDQYCIAAPLEGARTLKYVNPHMKFGEIVGLAVRDATLEALRWQNGLEASYTRGLFHALGRYGIKEKHDLRSFGAAARCGQPRSAAQEQQVGVLRAACRRRRARGRFGAGSGALWNAAAVVAEGRHCPAGCVSRREPRCETRSLAAVPRRSARGDRQGTGRACRSRHRARLEREVEGLTAALSAQASTLAVAVLLDLALGDPVYRFHPVRLMGASLTAIENGLRRLGADGYGGGIALFVILAMLWIVIVALALFAFAARGTLGRVDLPRLRRLQPARVRRSASSRLASRTCARARRSCGGASGGRPACRARHRPHGRGRLPPRRYREPERESSGWICQCDLLVRASRTAGPRRVQGRQHHGFHGRLQDAALSPLRMVRRAAGRRDEFPAGAHDMAAHRRQRRVCPGLFAGQGIHHRLSPKRRFFPVRIPVGRKRRPQARSSVACWDRSGRTGNW